MAGRSRRQHHRNLEADNGLERRVKKLEGFFFSRKCSKPSVSPLAQRAEVLYENAIAL